MYISSIATTCVYCNQLLETIPNEFDGKVGVIIHTMVRCYNVAKSLPDAMILFIENSLLSSMYIILTKNEHDLVPSALLESIL